MSSHGVSHFTQPQVPSWVPVGGIEGLLENWKKWVLTLHLLFTWGFTWLFMCGGGGMGTLCASL